MMFQVTNVITILIPLWGMVSRLVIRETMHCADVLPVDWVVDHQDWLSQQMGVSRE